MQLMLEGCAWTHSIILTQRASRTHTTYHTHLTCKCVHSYEDQTKSDARMDTFRLAVMKGLHFWSGNNALENDWWSCVWTKQTPVQISWGMRDGQYHINIVYIRTWGKSKTQTLVQLIHSINYFNTNDVGSDNISYANVYLFCLSSCLHVTQPHHIIGNLLFTSHNIVT